MMVIGEVKVQFRNYLERQDQQRRSREMAIEATIVPNIFTTYKVRS